jgi:hypothetical protein
MAERREFAITDLEVDAQNPRLEEGLTNQREAIRAMVRVQGDKVLRLAGDVVERGFDLSTLAIVMPSIENKGRYTVLEGNRRLTAVRLLENPELSQGLFSPGRQKRLVGYSKQYKANPITKVLAVEFPDRESADVWIERRHTGYQAGVGIIPWGSKEAARFNERRGRRSPALQVLNFVKDSGILDQTTLDQLEDFPLTNLDRLISDPAARDRLGLTKSGDEMGTQYPSEQIIKGLGRVVRDLATKKIQVPHIETKEKRAEYLDTFKKKELPDPTTKTGQVRLLADASASGASPDTAKKKTKSRSTRDRKTVIPKGTKISTTDQRLRDIFDELYNCDIMRYTNACAVLFRVFIELSVDHYIDENKMQVGKPGDKRPPTLTLKMEKVADHLEQQGKMKQQQLKAARRIAKGQDFLAAGIESFHAFVHNKYFTPTPHDLKVTWNNLELFLQFTWS